MLCKAFSLLMISLILANKKSSLSLYLIHKLLYYID